ncbi:hypothetical protein [Kitasatospora sp. NPDC059327]|uniref:hypothetical protein n=1 Tax=Kitasatospora sp. NPDC059327 TaxID=3346803 RepID=UPI003683FDB3
MTANAYHLRTPVDGLTACGGTPAFTYDRITYTSACSLQPGVQATTFHLRKPVNGLWACTVPSGFTYSTTTQNTDCSYTQGVPSTKYLLLG